MYAYIELCHSIIVIQIVVGRFNRDMYAYIELCHSIIVIQTVVGCVVAECINTKWSVHATIDGSNGNQIIICHLWWYIVDDSSFIASDCWHLRSSFGFYLFREKLPFYRWHFQIHLLNENIWILIEISLNFLHGGPINWIPALVQIMTWRRPGDKPLSKPMILSLLATSMS